MRCRRTLSLLAPVLAAAALAPALAGCGSGGSPAATLDPVAQAAETTIHSGGAQVLVHVGVDAGGAGSLTLSAHGDIDLHTGEGEIFLTSGGLPAGLGSSLTGNLQITELLTGGKVYLSSPLFTGQLPGGAHWVVIDPGSYAKQLGLDASSLTSGELQPGQYLQYLRASGGTVHPDGTAVVRGTRTTHYSGTIDLRKAVASLAPAKDRAAAEAAIAKLTALTGSGGVPVQAWIDSQGRVRRIRIEMPLELAGQHIASTVEEELFGFGAVPAVHAPSSSETYAPSLPSLDL